MSRRNHDRFKLLHTRDLTRPSFEECPYTNFDARARQQRIEAGCFLDGQGDTVRPGHLPVATIYIAIQTLKGRTGYGAGLAELTSPHAVTVTCPSEFIVANLMHGHVHRWRHRGWKISTGNPVSYWNLWEQILDRSNGHLLRIRFPELTDCSRTDRATAIAFCIGEEPKRSPNALFLAAEAFNLTN